MNTPNQSGDTNELHVILGAGPVGLAIMDELAVRGKRIRIVNRSGAHDLKPGVESAVGSITDPAFGRKAVEGATHIYDALNVPYDKWPVLFPPLQAAVLELAATAHARLIVLENVYMYGDTHGKPLTEDLPYAAKTIKGKVRAKMAQDLLAAHRSGKVRVVIGRASDFIGPRALDGGIGSRVVYPALAGKAAQVLGKLDMPHTYTYVPDVGKALVMLGATDEAYGEAWHIPAAETVSSRRYIEMIYAEAGNPVKITAAPKLMLRLLGVFNPIMASVYEMLYEFEEPFIVDHSKFVRRFGNIATPIAAVVRETVAWYRANPPSGH